MLTTAPTGETVPEHLGLLVPVTSEGRFGVEERS